MCDTWANRSGRERESWSGCGVVITVADTGGEGRGCSSIGCRLCEAGVRTIDVLFEGETLNDETVEGAAKETDSREDSAGISFSGYSVMLVSRRDIEWDHSNRFVELACVHLAGVGGPLR